MLIKPEIPDQKIIACLQAEFGLSLTHVAFLPLGGDESTAVFRVVLEDKTSLFCKLKRGPFDETTVVLPKFLSEQGLTQIIAPFRTKTGQLFAVLEAFTLILYPFVEGTEGYEVELSEAQWTLFGATLQRLHTTPAPPALLSTLKKERFSPFWRERCQQIFKSLDEGSFEDPLTLELVAFLQTKRTMMLAAVARAEQLAAELRSRSLEFVLCHADLHPGNLLIDPKGTLFIVDWDYPLLAPKERDLMFIGGGQGFRPYIAAQEERLFYRGYALSSPDPQALAYYRYERGITDVSVEAARVLSPTLGQKERAQALEILHLYFLPGCTLEMAKKTDEVL